MSDNEKFVEGEPRAKDLFFDEYDMDDADDLSVPAATREQVNKEIKHALEQHRESFELDHIRGSVKQHHLSSEMRAVFDVVRVDGDGFVVEDNVKVTKELNVGIKLTVENVEVTDDLTVLGFTSLGGTSISTNGGVVAQLRNPNTNTYLEIYNHNNEGANAGIIFTSEGGSDGGSISLTFNRGHDFLRMRTSTAPHQPHGSDIARFYQNGDFWVFNNLSINDEPDSTEKLRIDGPGAIQLRDRDSNGDTTNVIRIGSYNRLSGSGGRYDMGILVSTGASPRDFWLKATNGAMRLRTDVVMADQVWGAVFN